jgi:hypothetical protein
MTSFFTSRRAAAVALAAAVVLAPAGASFAQGGAAMPSPAQQQAALEKAQTQQATMLKKELGFSDAQIKQFQAKQKTIITAFQGKIAGMRKKYGEKPTPEQQQKAMAELQPAAMQMGQQLQAALMSVATPAQQAKIKAKMAEAQKKGGGGAMAAGGKP